MQLDLAKNDGIEAAFCNCDLVINASATVELVNPTINMAMKCRVDYMDTQLSFPEKVEALKKLDDEFVQKNMTVITDAGFHPGIPAALIRYAASKIELLKKANVSSYIGINWKKIKASPNTMVDFANEMKEFNPTVLMNRKWEKISFGKMDNFQFDFGDNIGTKKCFPMYLHELQSLPDEFPSLEETGFYIAGFNWFADYIAIPLVILAMNMNSKWMAQKAGKFFYWSLSAFAKPPFKTVLQLDANGKYNGKKVDLRLKLSHEDSYVLTAAPIVACIIQYLKKEHSPGFYFQSHFVNADEFLKNLKKLGVEVMYKKTPEQKSLEKVPVLSD